MRCAAATGILKLFHTFPECIVNNKFETTLRTLILDPEAPVIANALTSLSEIEDCEEDLNVLTNLLPDLLPAIIPSIERGTMWDKIKIIDVLAKFSGTEKQSIYFINHMKKFLLDDEPVVVMSAIKVRE